MSTDFSLYDRTLKITQSNESLYDHWEFKIAARMAQKWPEAFALTAKVSGSDQPTVTEVADMGESKIDNTEEFLSDLREIFRVLAKCCPLDADGNWC